MILATVSQALEHMLFGYLLCFGLLLGFILLKQLTPSQDLRQQLNRKDAEKGEK